jgi:hypothetical protein
MSARALMAQLARDGVTLQSDNGRLKVKARVPLDARVLAEVQRHKPALLQLLAAQEPTPAIRTFDAGGAYDAAAAVAYAHELQRRGEISDEQRDNLLRYADEARGHEP